MSDIRSAPPSAPLASASPGAGLAKLRAAPLATVRKSGELSAAALARIAGCADTPEAWVRKPSDEISRAAFAAAEQARFGTPEAWAGVAAFWSGDSMAPAGQPAVPPAPHLAGLAITGAVTLASVRADPARQAARLARFLASGRDIASGGPGRMEAEAS